MGRHVAPRHGYAWWIGWSPRGRRERRNWRAFLAGWQAGEKHE